jgi:hypothetical protein
MNKLLVIIICTVTLVLGSSSGQINVSEAEEMLDFTAEEIIVDGPPTSNGGGKSNAPSSQPQDHSVSEPVVSSDSNKKQPKNPKPKCRADEYYDPDIQSCVPKQPTVTVCPEGSEFDPVVNSCVVIFRDCTTDRTESCRQKCSPVTGDAATVGGLGCDAMKNPKGKIICKVVAVGIEVGCVPACKILTNCEVKIEPLN